MLPIEHVEGAPVHRVCLPDVSSIRRTSAYFRALIALCQNPATRPDVIQLHSFERLESLFWLSRLRRLDIPILYAIQIARPGAHRSTMADRVKTSMQKAFYNHFDGVITNSEPISGHLRSIGVRTPIAVISNGVDLDQFRPCLDDVVRSRTRRSLGIKGSGRVILSVGAVCPRKGSDLLIEAWTKLQGRLPDVELVLVGPRHDRNNPSLRRFGARLRRLIADSPRPDRIHFTGVRDDMNEVYGTADIVVLPSSREGMPNVVLEAMACERPVVLTPFEGQSESIGRPGIEFVQSQRTPDALAKNLAALLGDRDRRDDLVRHGKAWVKGNLDLELSLDHFAEFYRQTAAGTRAFSMSHEMRPILSKTHTTPARVHPS